MARAVTTRVLFNRLPQIAVAVEGAVATEIRRSLTHIEQDVKGGVHAAPYDTGNLRRSYHQEMTGPLEGEVGNDPGMAHYAIYVEMGTYKMAPQPHLVPAAEAEAPVFGTNVIAAIRAAAR